LPDRLSAENILRIGEHLVAVKERLEHGKWLPWLQSEFGWTDMTAQRFMQVYRMVPAAAPWAWGGPWALRTFCQLDPRWRVIGGFLPAADLPINLGDLQATGD
jgi:Protein of unknown function (DUF3102)